MISIPVAVWKPSQKDLLADLNPAVARYGVATTAAAAIIGLTVGSGPAAAAPVPIPGDKVLVVTHIGWRAAAGAAQTITSVEVRFSDAAGQRVAIVSYIDGGGGVTLLSREPLSGPLIVAPSDGLHLLAVFSAAGNPNTFMCGVHGYLVPRGNWQFA